MDATPIDPAMERMSVAPGAPEDDGKPAPTLAGDAGTDESIAKRLYKNPESKEARLDRGLDESMDASDPPSSTQPGDKGEPPKSSGFDEEAEAERQQDS